MATPFAVVLVGDVPIFLAGILFLAGTAALLGGVIAFVYKAIADATSVARA